MYPFYTGVLAGALTAYAPLVLARRLLRGAPVNLRERLGRGHHARAAQPSGWCPF